MAASSGKFASLLSPVFLRLALGVTFIWAGLGKIIPVVHVQGVDAALLANAGVTLNAPRRTPPPPAQEPAGNQAPQPRPPKPLPLPPTSNKSSTNEPTPTPTPGKRTRTRPAPSPDDQVTAGHENPSILPAAQTSLTPLLGTQPEKQPTPEKPKQKPKKSTPPTPKPKPSIDDPAEPAAPPPTAPPPAAPEPIKPPPVVAPPPPPPAPSWPAFLPKGSMTAADFPDAVGTRRVHHITLLLIKSAFPPPRADGTPGKPAWPVRLALDPWPRYIAWASALVELIGGILVLTGFFTRLGAFTLSTVMLSAIWLTQIGPAIASGQTTLMILPTRTWWEPSQWAVPLWQLANLCMSLALVAAGPGWLALDKAFASGGGRGKKPHAEAGED